MKIYNYFIATLFVAALLTGCGSGSSPSHNDVEKAVTQYVGLAKPDIGDVKLDNLKITKEYTNKVGDDDVFYRNFEAHYTVIYKDNPSKHSFIGTVALHKEGQNWVVRKDQCTLAQVESPPIVDAATQAEMDRQGKIYREQRDKANQP